ncbi:SLATT domain-containing protein [Streptomyces sp. JJ36]|uniref:SLATT domain-containing protein n=1 Tax=Streptomyces sp. JJ36 TaxID=2736645 RepID=UPI001F295565|nr:SLATT domain-containing protein [Streptomyces sp. JJ36]MCF6525678.1 SLATT domain-containing protein [Streptomyces sp. JJ36]
MIEHRRAVADLQKRIKNRRLQVFGLWAAPILAFLAVGAWVSIKVFVWRGRDMPTHLNGALAAVVFFFVAVTILQCALEFSTSSPWEDCRTAVRKLKLDLELAEEERILEARRRTPPAPDRQSSYKERIPGEIARLRKESRHYRRQHLFMQWLLFVCSAAISGVTAWYDPPQPGKGVLIGLSFTVTVITAAAGYFKPRERAFNLQQTADSIEQQATALDLGIAPYNHSDEKANLESFATTVEGLRADQRMREQQLDQPQQGQHQVM